MKREKEQKREGGAGRRWRKAYDTAIRRQTCHSEGSPLSGFADGDQINRKAVGGPVRAGYLANCSVVGLIIDSSFSTFIFEGGAARERRDGDGEFGRSSEDFRGDRAWEWIRNMDVRDRESWKGDEEGEEEQGYWG